MRGDFGVSGTDGKFCYKFISLYKAKTKLVLHLDSNNVDSKIIYYKLQVQITNYY